MQVLRVHSGHELNHEAKMPTLTSLVSFNGTDGFDPQGELIADSQGDLFGTASSGGPNGGGTVFEIVYANGVYASQPTTLASFSQGSGIYAPVGPLVTDSAGTIFGETVGTDANDNGSIFDIQKTSSGYAAPTLLWTFSFSANGITSPTGGLAIDAAGDLFSSESQAGAYGDGAVFELVRAASGNYFGPQILASFDGSNGIAPTGPVTVDAAGDIFGTTVKGGANNDGTVFEIPHTASGYGSIVTLANFNGANGLYPGPLVMDAAGDLFGTTSPGSTVGSATVFEIPKLSSDYGDLTTLVKFDNGGDRIGPLSLDASGNIYGTTLAGGVNGMGSVFEIANSASGYATSPSVLYNFDGSDGQTPSSAILADSAGNLYGTTAAGGANNDGTIYQLNPTSGSGTGTVSSEPVLKTLATFTGDNGALPNSPLVSDSAGDLFGTTLWSGSGASTITASVIYEIAKTADGYGPATITLYNFAGDPNGSPNSPLVADPSGDLFGTTSGGTVFELGKTASGYASAPATLATFGSSGPAGLIMDSSGDLIGVTRTGGANGDGSIFEIAKTAGGYASTPTTLANFDGTNGSMPADLLLDSSGDIFGVAADSNGSSIVFELAHTGQGYASAPVTVATIANNAPSGFSEAVTGLSIDTSGNLFGTAVYNPAPAPMDNGPSSGMVFEIAKTASGYESTSTTLATGFVPWSGVTVDGAGNLWGTSRSGIFELPKEANGYAATPTIINGVEPVQPLLADSNGNLFDVSSIGTYLSEGTVFELTNTGFVTPGGGGGTTGETLTANDTAGQQLTGTPNNDTFYAGHNSVVMTGDGGADTFIFQYLPWNAGSITDFNTADDKLDISAILSAAGYTGSDPVADGYLILQSDGSGDTQVLVNTHDPSTPWPFLITTLDGVAPASITPADYGYGTSSGGGGGGGGGTTGETLTANDTAGQQLTGTPNNDTFYAGSNSVVMTGDGGADTFIFQYLPWNAGSITDFNTADDKLDISAILSAAGYTGSDPVADGYLILQPDGSGDTQVLVNTHDPSTPWPFLITTLDGVAPASITPADYGYGTSSGGGGSGGGSTVETSDTTYTAPDGVTNIILTGSSAQHVTANNQGDTITSNDYGSTIIGGSGNDTLIAGHSADMFTGSAGNDSFVYNYLPWNAGMVSDFAPGTDVLNLKGIFASIGYTGSDPVADGYLAFISDGAGDTRVIVAPQGPSTTIPITVTTLDHIDPSMVHSGDYLFA
jgi:uncharacterized repeat protein (TIGR03803 family)